MTRAPTVDDGAVDMLLAYATEWSGFQPESVAREAVRRALARELARGASVADVLRRAADDDPALVRTLCAAVGVRETYLFRHPEQFEILATQVPTLAAGGVIRAWSAGCATGEEAWSLAATLVATLPNDARDGAPRIAVLGTDIDESSVETARAGIYHANSLRKSTPLVFPVVTPIDQRFEVVEALRHITSFVTHDLREFEPGQFEVIFCRNVLLYFTRSAARVVLGRLVAALAPGGIIAFGTMDVDLADLTGLARIGRPEAMMFTNTPQPTRRRRPTTRKQPAHTKPSTISEAIALHRSALVWIELGSRDSAEKLLADLNRRYPEYLPGILERALVHVRKGEHVTATAWMKEVLRRAEELPADHTVPGLEPLTADFYCDAARAYLDRGGRAREGT